MRVLIPCPVGINPFLKRLAAALRTQEIIDDVTYDLVPFWGTTRGYEVLHIHWPEALFEWQEPDEDALRRVDAKLDAWCEQAKIIVTIHNRHPHYRDTVQFRRLYSTVYRHARGIIHIGQTSVSEFREAYPALSHLPYSVIPIGEYDCFRQEVTLEASRQWLGIPNHAFTCVSFGALRHIEEVDLLVQGFRAVTVPAKHLVIAGQVALPRSRLKRWFYRLRNLHGSRVTLALGYIPDDEVQYYVTPGDVLVIPRLQVLNSANVSLGFTFGKVVVGPRTGVVGEVLESTGNPTFAPGDAYSLAEALQKARDLCEGNKGQWNRAYASRYWNWQRIAQQHARIFETA